MRITKKYYKQVSIEYGTVKNENLSKIKIKKLSSLEND